MRQKVCPSNSPSHPWLKNSTTALDDLFLPEEPLPRYLSFKRLPCLRRNLGEHAILSYLVPFLIDQATDFELSVHHPRNDGPCEERSQSNCTALRR